ncbi:MAG: type I restriction enzyme HsdR N-terminal domain-containing protein [Ferruginibacter sp.]|nr:type I restriction enzyme HsdR N-terminal domain-containing protein [Ferruginibacter sp.]
MIKIDYPLYQPKIKKDDNTEYIFDNIRNKWIVLTPEEWVRQNFLNYLINALHYPKALIAVEKEINIGDVKKRFDIIVYNKATQPWMLIECKEMNVSLSQKVLTQIINYNVVVKANFLVLTNGVNCVAYGTSNNELLLQLPDFEE